MNARQPLGALDQEAAVEAAVHRDYLTEDGFKPELVEDVLRNPPRGLIKQLAAATKGYGQPSNHDRKQSAAVTAVGQLVCNWLMAEAYERADEDLKEA